MSALHRILHVSTIAIGLALAATLARDAMSSTPAPARAEARPAATRPTASLRIEQPWTRARLPGAPVVGGFLTIVNTGRRPDRLLSITSPDAERVEIHEMRMDGGMMRMRRLDDGLPLPAGARVELKPGGLHLMFIGPKSPFKPGDTVTATLRFEHGGERQIRFEVRDMAAGGHS